MRTAFTINCVPSFFQSLYSCLLCQSLSEYEVSRYQLIQVLLHEWEQNDHRESSNDICLIRANHTEHAQKRSLPLR